MKYTEAERLAYAKCIESEEGIISIDPTADIHPTACIGKDGFGWIRQEDGTLYKMPHRFGVKIHANVSIGAHTCIDRGASKDTIIFSGVKIDNLVHCAHGVIIGPNTIVVAGTVIGGSVYIGSNCYLGMGCLIKNGVRIGNNVTIGMGAVVLRDIPDGETWIGNPARKLEKK